MRQTWIALWIAVWAPACSAIVQPDVDRLRGTLDGGTREGGTRPIDAAADPCPGGCDDGIACTIDVCAETGCSHSPAHATCPEGQLCGALGCMIAPCGGDGECDDGLACNGRERCVGGACIGGEAIVCDDGVECTEDACNETSGTCSSVPRIERCIDGIDCTRDVCLPRDDGADARGCVHAPDDDACDAECRVGAVCDPTIGCEGGDLRDCGDDDPCTADRCEAPAGCLHEPRDDDGDGYPTARVATSPISSRACEGGTDCDDRRPEIHPGATERCRNGRDDDCDGTFDEGCGFP